MGKAATCAARMAEYLVAGADELVLHGTTPELLGPAIGHFATDERRGHISDRIVR
jgi:hypothetical protein